MTSGCLRAHAHQCGSYVWNVEELFRRTKKGGVVPWGPSHQWVDSSLRLHTFATVIGLETEASVPKATFRNIGTASFPQVPAKDFSLDIRISHI